MLSLRIATAKLLKIFDIQRNFVTISKIMKKQAINSIKSRIFAPDS